MSDPEILEAVQTFVAYAEQRETRLQKGAKLRQEMHKALEAGQRPTGYRLPWVKESAGVLIHVLGEIAKEFDQTHLDDKCSVADLMDIVATAMGMLQKESGEDKD